MKLLLTGATGQLGSVLADSLGVLGQVIAVGRNRADLARPDELTALVDEVQPDIVVNAAAYTAVDKAEDEEMLAMTVNGIAPGVLAAAAKANDALFVHYSTDYVFDGTKQGAYIEEDPTCPINAYGRSKLAGEQAVSKAAGDWLVLRTSWVYGAHGNNFFNTMLHLAQSREQMRVVSDQIGAPTSVGLISATTLELLQRAQLERTADRFTSAVYHLVASGEASWHEFATAIVAGARRYLPADAIKVREIKAIPSSAYPTPATRPANSRLSNKRLERYLSVEIPDWRLGLEQCLTHRFAP